MNEKLTTPAMLPGRRIFLEDKRKGEDAKYDLPFSQTRVILV